MPKLVSEIASGQQFQRTQDQNGIADSQTRVFRVLLNQSGEIFDIQRECGVFIGDQHPYNTNIYCNSFSANFEGDSRMVALCTFQYQSLAGSNQQDPQDQPPDIRPANWSTSTSLMEAPVRRWKEFGGEWEEANNPVGDIYDGVTKLVPITTIAIEQYEPSDPTRHCRYAGYVNFPAIQVGSLNCDIRTVMFRGVSCRPSVESWGNAIFRGWRATYEFLYKPNWDSVWGQVGWDILVPQTGFNVRAFAPGAGGDKDDFGQPLRHGEEGSQFYGRIKEPLSLPANVNAGDKVKAMVKVFSYEGGGASQTPASQPVPLNDDGTPRVSTADPKVIVNRYQVQDQIDFRSTFQLRLE